MFYFTIIHAYMSTHRKKRWFYNNKPNNSVLDLIVVFKTEEIGDAFGGGS
jgi:hypothetical protein